jgi:SSS family solute:Na+ symporter
VSADNVQFVLMYAGFLIALRISCGGSEARLPPGQRSRHALRVARRNPPQYIFVWYLIALQTLVRATFYQRAFAAQDERVARNGVLISIGFWMLFDFLTTMTGSTRGRFCPISPIRSRPIPRSRCSTFRPSCADSSTSGSSRP